MSGYDDDELHWEDLAFVADMSDRSALLGWGRVPFLLESQNDGGGLFVVPVDQSDLEKPRKKRGFLGSQSPSFGRMRVVLTGPDGATRELTSSASWIRIDGLLPDTSYRVQLFLRPVDKDEKLGTERPFAPTTRLAQHSHGRTLYLRPPVPIERRCTTHPSPTGPTPAFRFFVLGDQGTGIVGDDDGSAEKLQAAVALRMNAVSERKGAPPVRFMLGTGDNVYAKKLSMVVNLALKVAKKPLSKLMPDNWGDVSRDSGDEDDEWYTAFFAPYQRLLAHIPFYPVAGNHDGDETENQDDRRQLADNLYLVERFGERGLHSPFRLNCKSPESICKSGLFYRFRFGRDFEFAALDTSNTFPVGGTPYMAVNAETLDQLGKSDARWVVPFAHHAPFGAGPSHVHDAGDIRRSRAYLWTNGRLRSPATRVSFFGHEHNFQHFCSDEGNHVFITGGAGKASLEEPPLLEHAIAGHDGVRLRGWGTGGHFLECTFEPERQRLTVTVHGVELGREHANASWRGRLDAAQPIVIEAGTP